MKNTIVADDNTIINTQGIRYVEKIDRIGRDFKKDEFELVVTYKGDKLRYVYTLLSARNAQFDALKTALAPKMTAVVDSRAAEQVMREYLSQPPAQPGSYEGKKFSFDFGPDVAVSGMRLTLDQPSYPLTNTDLPLFPAVTDARVCCVCNKAVPRAEAVASLTYRHYTCYTPASVPLASYSPSDTPRMDERMLPNLRMYLDTLTITGETIGAVRRSLCMPFPCEWNKIVRDETAVRERASGLPFGDQQD